MHVYHYHPYYPPYAPAAGGFAHELLSGELLTLLQPRLRVTSGGGVIGDAIAAEVSHC
jgi:hypothetical protein